MSIKQRETDKLKDLRKTISFTNYEDALDYIQKKPNASEYVCQLIRRDIKRASQPSALSIMVDMLGEMLIILKQIKNTVENGQKR